MLKSDLIDTLTENTNLSRRESRETVDTFFETIINGLQNSREFEIRGFGSFRIRECQARAGLNLNTMEKIIIPPKKVVYFKSGKELRDKISKKR